MKSCLRDVLVLAIVAASQNVLALDTSRSLTQSIHRIWQAQQGLPQAWIYSVAQTADGYLWLGTQTGLVKFDGVRFAFASQHELDGIPNSELWVTRLLEDRDGALWIGTARAGLIRLKSGRAARFSTAHGLPAGSIQCLFEDREGHVWACTPNGLAELTDDTVIRVYSTADGLGSSDVRAACVTSDGTVLAGVSGDSALSTWNGEDFVPRPLVTSTSAVVQTILCGSNHTVWVGTSDGLIRIDAAGERRLRVADGLAADSILTLMESTDGSVFAGTTNGFSRIRGADVDSFRPQDGLSQSTVYALFEDREGSLWAATKHGLNQFIDGRAIPYTTSEGLPSNNTGPVLQDRRGTIWVGTLGAGLARFDGRTFATLTTADGLTSDTIRSFTEDASGDLWVGSDEGVTRLRSGRVDATWTVRNGLPDNRVRALYADRSGAVWIATAGGPAVVRGGRLRAIDARHATPDAILAFAETADPAAPDTSSSFSGAAAMFRDRDGLLWVGSLGAGLRLVDGDRTFTFSVLDGLFDDVIYGIVEDDYGRLWIACSKGIFSVNRDDLRQFAAGKIAQFVSTPYSPLDGLRTVECQAGVQPAAIRAADGRLWFSTIRGVLVIDPAHFERKLVPPSVILEDVVVNGQRRRPTDIETLPAGSTNLEFNYTAASFIAPARITFRYRLDGLDNAWVEAGSRREAFYSNLGPGSFQFRVAACTPDGECSEDTSAFVAFTIAPRFYQNRGFIPLCAAVIALGGVAAYRLRIRRLKEQFDLVLAERGRIARELHDTLIQGFSGITMGMQAVATRLAPGDERRRLEAIVADAGQAMREARRSLTGLRTHDSASSGLAGAVAQAARQLTEPNSVKLKLSLTDCEVPADVEYHLLRIVQEAILNAVKHSGARTLRITLNSAARNIVLSVKDDGAGFDYATSPPEGHFGLVGMRERAAQIGANLIISSVPGEGTTVRVQLQS